MYIIPAELYIAKYFVFLQKKENASLVFLLGMVCVLLFQSQQVFAQNDSLSTEKIYEEIDLREFDSTKLKQFQEDPDFYYDRDIQLPQIDSWWNALQRHIDRTINRVFRIEGIPTIWQILKYIFFVCLVLYALKRLFRMDTSKLFKNSSAAPAPIVYKETVENIHKLNFNQLLKEAIAQKNHRKAIRLYYLKTLKVLTDKKVIDWKPHKTNEDYRRELARSNYAGKFKEISLLFDYVWYGEFGIDEQSFHKAEQDFEHFFGELNP